MKTTYAAPKQFGFFDLGLGLALFAIFGAVSWGMVSAENEQKEIATKQQLGAPWSDTAYACRQIDSNGLETE